MRITRLTLTAIRRHRSLVVEPVAGLTVIRGPNESGKSTIQESLELVLFRRATTTATEVAAMRSWGAEVEPMIELAFELDGREGRLAKRFGGSRGQVRLELDGVVDTDPTRVDQILTAALGIPSEKFFRSTASVRHFEMEDLDRDERALRDRLQASIGGGDVGASTARRQLDERIRQMRAAGQKAPGPLRVATEDIARLAARLAEGEAALARLSADRAALAAATAARLAVDEEVRAATLAQEEAESAVRLDAEARALAARYEHLRRATDLAERLAVAESTPPAAMPPADIRPTVDRLHTMALLAERLEADLAAATEATRVAETALEVAEANGRLDAGVPPMTAPVVTARPAVPPGVRSAVPWRPLAVGAGLVAAAVLLLGLVAGPPVLLVLSVLMGVVAAAAVVMARREGDASTAALSARAIAQAEAAIAARAVADEAARRVADARDRHDRAVRARADMEARLAATHAESAVLCTGMGVPDLAAAEALLAASEGHAAGLEGLRAELRGLLGAEAPADPVALRAQRDEAARRAAMGGHALEGMGATGADPESARLRAGAALRAAR